MGIIVRFFSFCFMHALVFPMLFHACSCSSMCAMELPGQFATKMRRPAALNSQHGNQKSDSLLSYSLSCMLLCFLFCPRIYYCSSSANCVSLRCIHAGSDCVGDWSIVMRQASGMRFSHAVSISHVRTIFIANSSNHFTGFCLAVRMSCVCSPEASVTVMVRRARQACSR